MHVYATSLNESNIRVTRFNSPTCLHFIFAYKDIHFCKYTQHIKPEHDGVFFHFSQVTKEIIVRLNTYPKTLKCLCLLWVETS